jgi:hypothetical protein
VRALGTGGKEGLVGELYDYGRNLGAQIQFQNGGIAGRKQAIIDENHARAANTPYVLWTRMANRCGSAPVAVSVFSIGV